MTATITVETLRGQIERVQEYKYDLEPQIEEAWGSELGRLMSLQAEYDSAVAGAWKAINKSKAAAKRVTAETEIERAARELLMVEALERFVAIERNLRLQ